MLHVLENIITNSKFCHYIEIFLEPVFKIIRSITFFFFFTSFLSSPTCNKLPQHVNFINDRFYDLSTTSVSSNGVDGKSIIRMYPAYLTVPPLSTRKETINKFVRE